ncbi:MAG TPA: hypothetical protein VGX49_01935 [Jatrophihabitans sp.]|jgi:ABC-type transporter Mla subunit MlaD|nr:hypothetical protein [Jatrophihabitans sp.]
MYLPAPFQLLELHRLEHLSRELAGVAGELGGLCPALRSRAADLPWHSAGARAFQAVLHELLGQLGQSGMRLAELSAAVRAHRQRATDRAAAMGRVAHTALDAVERAVRLP